MTNTVSLPKQTWWRRLLRRKRPAGIAYVSFSFKFGDDGWHAAEATVNYPEGVDAVKLTMECHLDGGPVYFGNDMSIISDAQ